MKKVLSVMALIIVMAAAFCLCSCSNNDKENNESFRRPTKEQNTAAKLVAVLTDIDEDNKSISFTAVENGDDNVYSYNNATEVYSKSKVAMSIAQLEPGDVVDLYYNTGSLIITKLQISTDDDVWENGKVTSFKINDIEQEMKIGKTLYYFTSQIAVFSEGRPIKINELTEMDQLTVRGYKNQVVSIVVDKGHGYVTLTGESLFVGGLINIGGVLARNIESGMLLSVTEGTYLVQVVNGNYKADKYVTVRRGEESVVDFSDVVAEIHEKGNVKFNIDVAKAKLYIDGNAYDYSSILTLPTGEHKIKVTASGYDDYEAKINIEAKYQAFNISLTEGDSSEDETETESETVVAGEDKVSKINDVTVTGPVGGSVYFDGTYMGTAPVTFDMVTGTHVISILYNKKINSYTVNLEEGANDVEYDFSDK